MRGKIVYSRLAHVLLFCVSHYVILSHQFIIIISLAECASMKMMKSLLIQNEFTGIKIIIDTLSQAVSIHEKSKRAAGVWFLYPSLGPSEIY